MALEFPPEFPFHRRAAAAVEAEPARDEAPAANAPAAPAMTFHPAAARHAASAPPPQFVMSPAGTRPPQDRRRSPRMTLVAKASIRPDSPVQVASMTMAGFVSNISMNGVGFHTRKPLEVGGKYRITVEVGPLKWSTRLRVVACRPHPESETFDCGAEFIGNELNRLPVAA